MNLGQKLGTEYPDTTAYLLQLDLETSQVTVNAYTADQMREANDHYLELEKENQGNSKVLVVLVAVDSINALRTTYPNYYLDSTAFIKALKEATQ